MHSRLEYPEILFVWMEPLLIRVFQRCGQRRHDLAAVAQVSSNLSPLLQLTYLLKPASCIDRLFELI